MKKEELTQLKEGQTVYIAVKYLGITTDGQSAHVKIPTTDWMDIGFHSVVSISPNVSFEHIVIPSPVKENKPKYDPCRPFKVGDEVRYCAPDGRIYADRGSLIEHIKNRDFTRVIRDELPNGKVGVFDPFDEENPYYVPAHSLELVTPVEELERYVVEPSDVAWFIVDKKHESGELNVVMYMTALHPHAKDAAQAECDRLNAEYRKEQE